jgi:pSer/pThr/pTyr-binding forkhead associated (FHA) protein
MSRKPLALAFPLVLAGVLAGALQGSLAQGVGPVVSILGEPDTEADPPKVCAYVSVVNPDTAQAIDGLPAENFVVKASGQEIAAATVEQETTGVAVVMVIDRGGIARQGDPRIGHAVDLASSLLDVLDIGDNPQGDLVALLGIRGREEEKRDLTPYVNLQDRDRNVVSNEFEPLRVEVVPEVTPLYDGLQEAIEMIADNPDADVREKLEYRRPIIVAFSDGIDERFSDEAVEIDIIDGCRDNNILLYAIRMEAAGRSTDVDNMQRLAARTSGLYMAHNDQTHDEVLALFERIVTQRNSYRVAFTTRQPRGDYTLEVQVETDIGTSDDIAIFHSPFERPRLRLASPADGAAYTVPYSHTPRVEIPLSVELTFPDGIARDPSGVRYYRNGVLVATATMAPFTATWDATDYLTQTEEMRETQEAKVEAFTFTAEADDPYLAETSSSEPVSVEVAWEPPPEFTLQEKVLKWLAANWWLLLVLGALALGMLILLVLLVRTRGEVARKVVARTTSALKGVTKRLGPMPQRAPGKLVVIQGANVGKGFRLAAQVVKVGRDPQFSDFALYDEYASNPHFSVQLDQTQFYITDEGSTNGTRVNGMPIPPHQRMLLQPDAIVEVGQTRLQFKRLGGTTRQLEAWPGAMPPQGQPQYPPTQPAPPSRAVQGPARPSQPPQSSQPTQPTQPGSDQYGPTRKVR